MKALAEMYTIDPSAPLEVEVEKTLENNPEDPKKPSAKKIAPFWNPISKRAREK